MKRVFVAGSNVITSLGLDPAANASEMMMYKTGIQYFEDEKLSETPFYASKLSEAILSDINEEVQNYIQYTKFEKFIISSVNKALKNTEIQADDKDTILILSTTKGNIDQLESGLRVNLNEALHHLSAYFKNPNTPLLISNACISGAVAIIVAKRLLETGQYKNAIVTGADIVSHFTLSGFQSFKALCEGPCKPFDKSRSGLSLGEGVGTLVLTTQKELAGENSVFVAGGGISNDANHISGPSRTGDGLNLAILAAVNEAREQFDKSEIGYVSSHGTATIYNDEMEAKALNLAGFGNVPVNSYKGFIGHTLGAAGLIEAIMGIFSLQTGNLLPSYGYTVHGVSKPLNIIKETLKKDFKAFLKTTSGFGGCNSAVIIGKE